MNENGFYTKWTYHRAVVTPDLCDGFSLHITKGRVDEHTLDYLYDVFWHALREEEAGQ